jgi:hypothetical protein
LNDAVSQASPSARRVAELDQQHASDDQRDAERHDPGEGFLEEQPSAQGAQRDADRGPDAVGDAVTRLTVVEEVRRVDMG